jgi:hypothetical protein
VYILLERGNFNESLELLASDYFSKNLGVRGGIIRRKRKRAPNVSP